MSRKEILFKPNFIDGNEKNPYCSKVSITLPENENFPHLASFYTTSYEGATQIYVIYNQYFLWPSLPID